LKVGNSLTSFFNNYFTIPLQFLVYERYRKTAKITIAMIVLVSPNPAGFKAEFWPMTNDPSGIPWQLFLHQKNISLAY